MGRKTVQERLDEADDDAERIVAISVEWVACAIIAAFVVGLLLGAR